MPSSTCDPATDASSGESHFSIIVFFKQAFMLLIVAARIKAEKTTFDGNQKAFLVLD